MDDQLDNDLKNRIKEVFDNFEDTSAGEGWLKLREKFPEKQADRRAFLWMWWGAAAILFLFLGAGLWMYSAKNSAEKYSVKNQKNPQSENLAGNKNKQDTAIKAVPQHTVIPAKTATANIAETHPHNHKVLAPHDIKASAPIITDRTLNNSAAKDSYIAKTDDSEKAAAKLSTPQLASATISKTTDTIKKAGGQQPLQQIAATTATSDQTSNPDKKTVSDNPKQPVKSIADMFAQDKNDKPEKIEKKSKRVDFGVYAATYFSYAKGSNNQANIGAGVTSDIKITENLKLETGITIAQNSLNFTAGVPTTTAQSSLPFFSAGSAPGALVVASAYNVNSAVTNAAEPAFKNYDANLVGLDIPVNLKYEFNAVKNNVYVLAGFSSGTFINETYTYQYNYPALFSPSLQQIQDETSRKSFNGFYFAKTLNLAFGVGYPLGKNRLIFEPFLKYPLDGMGSQNIRFGAGGVNLKFSFQSSNK